MFERLMFKTIELWILILVVIGGLIGTILFGWVVQHRAKGHETGGQWTAFALSLAEAPQPLFRLIRKGSRAMQPQMIEFSDFAGLELLDSSFNEDGYLLVSGYRPETKISTVYLYDLSKKQIIHQWVPPIEDILKNSSHRGVQNIARNYRSQHPLMIGDGDVVFSSGEGPLIRVDKCGKLKWVVDRAFHHSIERDAEGALVGPHIMPSSKHSGRRFDLGSIRDDGFAVVSIDGQIVKEWSVKQILEDNGYIGLIYGVGEFEPDRIHLNDAQPILQTDKFVEKGDFILSTRHLSSVFLYRPRTNKIVWLKTGPWLNQHDVDYQGNGIFTVFGNDMVRTKLGHKKFSKASAIYQYDQSNDSIKKVFNMEARNIFTPTQGLHEVLDNGDVFVEETESHILHRISATGHRWRFVNTTGDKTVGALNWSRYFGKSEIDIEWLKGLKCSNSSGGSR